jgi:uncharacterized protein (DUF1499 family)
MKAAALLLLTIVVVGLATLKGRAMRDEKMSIKPFRPCPATPNCVNSEAPKTSPHYIEPMKATLSWEQVRTTLVREMTSLPRVTLAAEEGQYMRFEVKSWLFRFVDDVEFQYDPATRTLHLRSASRTGKYDFDVNRKRMETIRSLLTGKI